jgi:sirohydrochlorin cobaltochelatase
MAKLEKLSHHILVCRHKDCEKQGARETCKAIKRAVKQHDLKGRVLVSEMDCLDRCGEGPVVVVYPEGVWYGGVDERDAREIVEEHVLAGRAVGRRVTYRMGGGGAQGS